MTCASYVMHPATSIVLVSLFRLTATDNQYYEYVGCYKKELIGKSKHPRVFNKEYHILPFLSLSLCLIHCFSFKYKYAALDSAHCGCSDNSGNLHEDVGCTDWCKLNPFPNVQCGGPKRLSVYKIKDTGYKDGCYRLLPLKPDKAITVFRQNSPYSNAVHMITRFVASSCIKHCAEAGFTFAALHNGDYCGCDTRLNHIFSLKNVYCEYPCEDIKLGTCGAFYRAPYVSIWKADPAAVSLLPSLIDPKFNEKALTEKLDANTDYGDDTVQEFTITGSGTIEWKNKDEEEAETVTDEGSGGGDSNAAANEEGSGGYGQNPNDDEGSGSMSVTETVEEDEETDDISSKISKQEKKKEKEKKKTDENYYDNEEENIEDDDVGSLGLPIGLGIGCAVALSVISVVAALLWMKRKKQKSRESSEDNDEKRDWPPHTDKSNKKDRSSRSKHRPSGNHKSKHRSRDHKFRKHDRNGRKQVKKHGMSRKESQRKKSSEKTPLLD